MKIRKPVLYALLCLFCLVAIALPAAPTQASGAYITITPSSGSPGDLVAVEGHEFDTYEDVYVLFGDLTIDVSIRGDAYGHWYFDFHVPLMPPGEYTVTAEGEVNTAVTEFRIKPLITISSTAGGSVTTPGEGAFTYNEGTVVDLVATPGVGCYFIDWTGDVDTIADVNAATTTITMNGHYSITANFEAPHDLTISSTPGGSVTTPGEGIFIYDEGTTVDLVATPDVGYGFVNWGGDIGTIADVNAATTTITMQGDYEITARFLPDAIAGKTETVTGGGTVDVTEEADTEVAVNGTATVTVALYEENPGGDAPSGFNALGKYIDVYVPDVREVDEIEIRLYYTDAEVAAANVSEESLQLFWWDGTAWVQCSDSGVNTDSTNGYSGYMWAKIRGDTTPTLNQLQGTEWGGYGHPSEPPQPLCSIATAAYGTDRAKEIHILREFRDTILLPDSLGAKLVSLYYEISPPIANFISQHEVLRTAVRAGFVDPIVKILDWSHDLWSTRTSQ